MEPIIATLSDAPFLTSLLQELATRFETLGSGAWAVHETSDATEAPDSGVTFTLHFEGSLHGGVSLKADNEAMQAIRAAAMLEEDADLSAGLVEQWIEPALEALQASANAGEWTATARRSESLGEASQTFALTMDTESGETISLWLSIDRAMSQCLFASRDSGQTIPYPEPGKSEAMNLDLVLDVELNVVLRFGQRQLTLREVLDLTSGSVIELDRQVEEPVELLLEGKVIARGEAVVIDGNYGLRVTEVPQPISHQMLA